MADTTNLRNIGIVAHVDAGKTTITEYMLYRSGSIRTVGSVDKGTAHTDWLEVERERGISVRAASTSFAWKDVSINLIDTPGHVDFSAEVERSLRVLDGAVLVVSAVEGVQAQTEILWKALRAMAIPTIIFVNKTDRIGSDVNRVISEIHSMLTSDAISLQVISAEGSAEPEIEDVWCDKSNVAAQNRKLYDFIVEYLVDKDEELLIRYLNGEAISFDELDSSLVSLVHSSVVFPVFYGAAIKGIGVNRLMDAVIRYIPPPAGDLGMPLSGIVFKIDHDRLMGRVAHVRLYNGAVKNRDVVHNATQDKDEKITQIRKINAQKHEDAGVLQAGDIAAVCGFSHVRIGDILGCPDAVPPGYNLASPLLKVQAYPQNEAVYPQLVTALQELSDEDPLLDLQWVKEERELHVKIMGVIQLEVLSSLLKSRFNLDVTFGKPSVIYKETPTHTAEGFVAYTMPKPCWAVLRFRIEPGERGSGLAYSSIVRDEKIMTRYQNQVQKTLPDALQQGLYGWEVTDLKVTLIDGEHHVMHTHPLDFVVATPMAVMDGLVNTGTTLLEPVLEFRISVPEELGGKILGDIVLMRGTFDSPAVTNGTFTVEGRVPAATSLEYPIKLASISGGRGTMSTRFAGYQECALELGATTPRRGINPLDQAKYILSVRKALGAG